MNAKRHKCSYWKMSEPPSGAAIAQAALASTRLKEKTHRASGGSNAAVAAAALAFASVKATSPAPVAGGTAFNVLVTGQIESISYPAVGNLYCRYTITYGADWRVIHGSDAGLTQLAYRSSHDGTIVFNFPIDISFKSTNPFGWPRIVFSVYGLDGMGRDIIKGYGSMNIPTCGGRIRRQVPLFKPLSSSLLQQFTAWLTGTPPEYFDAKFVTQNDGREVTRVTSAGKINISLNTVMSGMRQHGYSNEAIYA